MAKNIAMVNKNICVACGACTKVCPKGAISIWRGCYATIEPNKCVGCGLCAKTCPAGCITIKERELTNENKALV